MNAVFAMAGDTFFTHSKSLLGRVIRWGESDPGETNGVWANHTGVVIQSGWIGEPLEGTIALTVLGPSRQAVVVEALWNTRRGPLELKNGAEFRLFRPVPGYSPTELGAFTRDAETYVGTKYGWWKLLIQLADRQFFKGRKILTTALYRKDRPICSFLAAYVNQAAFSLERAAGRLKDLANIQTYDREVAPLLAGYAFGMPPQAADPDEMMDFCLDNPQWWMEVLAPPTPPETKAEEKADRKEARAEEVSNG